MALRVQLWRASAPFSDAQGKTNAKYPLEGLKPLGVRRNTDSATRRKIVSNGTRFPFPISVYPMRSCFSNSTVRSWVKLVSYIPLRILLLVALMVSITRAQYFKDTYLKLKQSLWNEGVWSSNDTPAIVKMFSPRGFSICNFAYVKALDWVQTWKKLIPGQTRS